MRDGDDDGNAPSKSTLDKFGTAVGFRDFVREAIGLACGMTSREARMFFSTR